MSTLANRAKELERKIESLPKEKRTDANLEMILRHASKYPPRLFSSDFSEKLARVFNVDISRVASVTSRNGSSSKSVDSFDKMVPGRGWISDYMEHVSQTEPPSVFQFFAAMVVLGAVVRRSVYKPTGGRDIYPNLSVVIVSPQGVGKKTTACDQAVDLFRDIGGTVMADKITPEALTEALRDSNGEGLLYAPEWAVMLGRQQYMEGLVPMLTALFDCPPTWDGATIMRGKTSIPSPVVSHLAASTLDWIQSSVSKEAIVGGFMSRMLVVSQLRSDKCFPDPLPLDTRRAAKLKAGMVKIQHIRGESHFTKDASSFYDSWYRENMKRLAADSYMNGHISRKPKKAIQLAILLTLSEHMSKSKLEITEDTLRLAVRMIDWIEDYMPDVFDDLGSSSIGDMQLSMLRQLKHSRGKKIKAKDWLNLNLSRMSSDTFRKCTDTLTQAEMIVFDASDDMYYLNT